MRYQMNRLRRLAANFQLQREASLTRHAEAISQALYPGGVLQERLHGAAFYFARYGFELAEELTAQAANHARGMRGFGFRLLKMERGMVFWKNAVVGVHSFGWLCPGHG